ncbi:hypothetical protein WJX72_002488 [[Myrmecia] bisecta]|uniref:Origin recognition complex subunit 4 n=1 Tax=[Myrmecia] bisecta TaxID=41462 RepID=A0AAW1PFX4_9CHLO
MEADASPMAASARRAAAVPVPATVHPIPERTNDELIEVWTEAFRYLKIRLLDIRSEACASIEMRPLLRAVHGKLLSLLTDTVQTAGANNSFLLIGPRGTGKTLVIQRALSDLHKRFNTDPASPQVGFVRLTGLAHTEDRSAFREIARQLCETFGMPFVKGASLEENLAFLRDMLKELARAHKVVVFVLDEFDMFTKRAKQTLLYNLLDAMQQADMQAAVVGVSCRGDVMELLEKRVRSRFSYRKELVLAESCLGLGLRPTAAATAGRASATAGMGPAPATSAATAAAATAATAASGSGTGADAPDPGNCPPAILRAMLSLPAGFAHPDVAASHNAAVARVLQDNTFLDALEVICKKGFSTPRDLVDVCVIALCGVWEPEKEGLSVHSMLAAVQEVCSIQDSQSMMVGSLSVLELYMLVAIQRIRRRGPQACNFEQVFDEYRRSLQLEDHPDKFSRAQAFRAFERLLSMALTFYVDPKAEQKGGLREFHAVAINVSHEEIEAGMKTVENCPSRLLTWLNREAVQASYAAD